MQETGQDMPNKKNLHYKLSLYFQLANIYETFPANC